MLPDNQGLPRFDSEDDLAQIAQRLRWHLAATTTNIGAQLGLDHSTVVRYENGIVKTIPPGYLACLALLLIKREQEQGRPIELAQPFLLAVLNAKLQPRAALRDWEHLEQTAAAFLARRGVGAPVPPRRRASDDGSLCPPAPANAQPEPRAEVPPGRVWSYRRSWRVSLLVAVLLVVGGGWWWLRDGLDPQHQVDAGLRAYQRGDYAESIRTLSRLSGNAAASDLVLLTLGKAQRRHQAYQQALVSLDRLLARNPANAEALFERGATRRALGQYALAVDDLERAIAHGLETGDVYYQLGYTYSQMGRFDRAVEQYQRAVDKRQRWALFGLGSAYYQMQEYQRSIDALDRFIDAHDEYGWAYLYRGFAYCALGDAGLAQVDVERARALPADEGAVARAQRWLEAGGCGAGQ